MGSHRAPSLLIMSRVEAARFVLIVLLFASPPSHVASAFANKRRSQRGGKRAAATSAKGAASAKGFGVGVPSPPPEVVPKKKPASAKGFGVRAPPPPPALMPKTNPAMSGGGGGGGDSLERKLRQQHLDNCAASAARWATCSDDGLPGSYCGGWHALSPAPPTAPGNEPYVSDRLILKSLAPLLSASDCEALICAMEAHGAANGWDARYPVSGFTREVNVADIPESVALLNRALERTLLPAAATEFGAFPASVLRVNEALVVKYDAATGNNCLPVRTRRLNLRFCFSSVRSRGWALCPPGCVLPDWTNRVTTGPLRWNGVPYDAPPTEKVHADFSYLTINVALSSAADYDGDPLVARMEPLEWNHSNGTARMEPLELIRSN